MYICKKNLLRMISFLFLIGLNSKVFATCNISSANEVLDLIKKNHPGINLNNSSKKAIMNTIDVAKQRPNPEFDADYMKGDSIDGDVTTTSLSIKHTFELGGKRDSRVDVAKKYIEVSNNKLKGSNEDIIIDSVVKAYRLRQIYELLPVYDEAFGALSKILKTKKSRKSLSPEEQVESETLVLATNDYLLKIARLNAEKTHLSRHLSFFLGKSCAIPMKALPRDVNLSQKFLGDSGYNRYSKLLAARNEVELASAKVALSNSKSLPDLKVGPAFENENINGRNFQSFGLVLSMDLPIFNTNKGGRAISNSELLTANMNLRNIEREASLDLQSWIDKYKAFSSSLKIITNRADLDRKHNRIEKLFKRGIISTAMVIESHRQLIEFANTRFEFELGAVEALWNIYKLNGTVLEKKL
ncbi:hypothetical protein A9Q84_16570 [Halobacteriovorax marinus]|uniref:Outer membrane efflux protein n=1 Tax=Halobacteriovorax marinus TaxID=97084 RepID=A0A1Y5F4E2_9BACT|nr:hypothetical protein A9Q84_16570 [Halobacteriovorax marinus]